MLFQPRQFRFRPITHGINLLETCLTNGKTGNYCFAQIGNYRIAATTLWKLIIRILASSLLACRFRLQ
jgi:hypothetical protein